MTILKGFCWAEFITLWKTQLNSGNSVKNGQGKLSDQDARSGSCREVNTGFMLFSSAEGRVWWGEILQSMKDKVIWETGRNWSRLWQSRTGVKSQGAGGEWMRSDCLMGMGSPLGWWNVLELWRGWWWLNKMVLNTTEVYTLKWLIVCCMNLLLAAWVGILATPLTVLMGKIF